MVEEGKFVAIHYTGKLEDGEVFDSYDGDPPFEFLAGSGMVIRGLDQAVIGMKKDEEKDIVIESIEAYGEYNDELIHRIPIDEVKKQFEPQVGMKIGVQMANGQQVPAEITEVTDADIALDANHPLAGKTLHFHVKVVDINDEATYQPEGGCGCDSGGCNSSEGCEPSGGCGC